MPDQVDNLLQDQVVVRIEPVRKCLRNKPPDILVNTVPVARSDMGLHNHQSDIFCHIASRCPKHLIQDHDEVHDITHHASNILLPGTRETEPVGDVSRWSLTSLDIYRKPNLRTRLQMRSSLNYRQFNSLDNSTCCAVHSPRRCAAGQHG